ncbi:ETX/MTX2 family pore-forming toxin [Streptomyces coerulescens]|uniref:ETX/MTX2 family pore-forming toxin n=1 Tax=Streptomyces coerulescens TaxID=29304 RepID=A0ABW0CUG4_STRCD
MQINFPGSSSFLSRTDIQHRTMGGAIINTHRIRRAIVVTGSIATCFSLAALATPAIALQGVGMPSSPDCAEGYTGPDPADPAGPKYNPDQLPPGFTSLDNLIKDAYLYKGLKHRRTAHNTRKVDVDTSDMKISDLSSSWDMDKLETSASTEVISNNQLHNGSDDTQVLSTSAFSSTYIDSETVQVGVGISDTATVNVTVAPANVGVGSTAARTMTVTKSRSCTQTHQTTYTAPSSNISVPPHSQKTVRATFTRGTYQGVLNYHAAITGTYEISGTSKKTGPSCSNNCFTKQWKDRGDVIDLLHGAMHEGFKLPDGWTVEENGPLTIDGSATVQGTTRTTNYSLEVGADEPYTGSSVTVTH